MAKRKWSLRHIVLLYTRFGGRPRGSRVSHTLPLSLILSSTERRFATRFYDIIRSYRLVEHPLPRFEALWCLVSGLLWPCRPIYCSWSPPLRRHIIGLERWPLLPKKIQWAEEAFLDYPGSFLAS